MLTRTERAAGMWSPMNTIAIMGTFARIDRHIIYGWYKGNHDMARDPILFAEKVGQHLTSWLEYRQIKTVIFPIDLRVA